MCREEAADLCAALSGVDVPVYGIVKEEELPQPVDAEKMRGVAEFESQYFCGPLYLSDEARTIYQFLGNKKIFTLGSIFKSLLKPWRLRRELKEMSARMKSRKIEGNMVGDGLIKGGVLCIAPSGDIKYTFYEDAGKGIPTDCQADIVAAVRSFGGGR